MLPILLHMHQPDYRDPATGVPVLPWVRKHALRGYRDVPWLLHRTGAQATVNLVPSLLDQLDFYANGGEDRIFGLLHRPLNELTDADLRTLAEAALLGSEGRFTWFPAFGATRHTPAADLTPQQRLDRIVWGELAWFGFSAMQDYPVLARLRARAECFAQADLDCIIAIERDILRNLRALYRNLPEVSCSPYYHPILPLLVNTAHADRCMPGVPDPGFVAPEDAEDQLRRGKARVQAWIDGPVVGLWPSEGSVSPEVARLARDAGFAWLASDDGVLRSSDAHADPSRPARFEGLTLVFREHELSDRVGFVYQNTPGADAARDLLDAVGNRPCLVALDGENPWQHYADAGEAFLCALFASGRTRSVRAYVAESPAQVLHYLHTGSWIHANFHIWIGHPDDRTAWVALRRTREAWIEAGRPDAAREHLYAAEGSDWFWWYGDDFSTPDAPTFDTLFRSHLAAVWTACGKSVPDWLRQSFRSDEQQRVGLNGVGPGQSFFDWQRVQSVIIPQGAMARSTGPSRLWLGRRGDYLVARCLRSEGWSLGWEGGTVPFESGFVTLPVADQVWLVSPAGERVGQWRTLAAVTLAV